MNDKITIETIQRAKKKLLESAPRLGICIGMCEDKYVFIDPLKFGHCVLPDFLDIACPRYDLSASDSASVQINNGKIYPV